MKEQQVCPCGQYETCPTPNNPNCSRLLRAPQQAEPPNIYREADRIANEVIDVCGLPAACHGTLLGALGEAYELGLAARLLRAQPEDKKEQR